ncbi:hypothetical protein GCK32_010788, partial [Trichostrongylus colubriformis]
HFTTPSILPTMPFFLQQARTMQILPIGCYIFRTIAPTQLINTLRRRQEIELKAYDFCPR